MKEETASTVGSMRILPLEDLSSLQLTKKPIW